MVENAVAAEYSEERRILRQVMQAEFVCACCPVSFDIVFKVVALVQEVDIFCSHIGEQQRLAAILRDIENLVQYFVRPRTQVCSEYNLFGTFQRSESIARFVVVVQEANLAHGILYVRLFDDNQVFDAGVNFLAVVLERELDFVQTGGSRSHQRANAELR